VDYVIGKEQPKVIIHCASFPRQKVVNANPALGADVMMRGLINLLESAKKHGVERFVYISSAWCTETLKMMCWKMIHAVRKGSME
jgi:nucleoside-diphosphate-sugar epimerase